MKYAIIIPDGAADEPLAELGGRTPLEVARTPNMDRVAAMGRQGLVRTIPEGFESGSDVATMCLLGYSPKQYHTGRAPLEAAALGIALAPTDWVFRCNLVTVTAGIMKDHSAGGIPDADARTLINDLSRHLAGDFPGFEFHCGVSYRNLLVYRGPVEFAISTTPPHEIPDLPAAQHAPRGAGADLLNRIMAASAELFSDHAVNVARRRQGLRTADQVWLWGQGHAPAMPAFAGRFGVGRGAMISSVDLLRGLAVLLGWDILDVPGMTSFHDTNYIGQGAATAAALDEHDLVFSHIEAPDEASHQGDWKTKIAAIEHIDQHIVGPVLEKMQRLAQWRLMVLPDHPTLISNRRHGYGPTPFAMAGAGVRNIDSGPYCEHNALASTLRIERGEELMEFFLRGGGA
jgi:2,3-bisphosphoglycerate-independent phosphoglycerate mutase